MPLNVPLIGQPQPGQVNIQHIDKLGQLPELINQVALSGPGGLQLIGGMTKRLAVAATLMPFFLHLQGGNRSNEHAARESLTAADVLIELEREDRR